LTSERIAPLRFESGKLGPAMQKIYEQFGGDWKETPPSKVSQSKGSRSYSGAYGDLSEVKAEVRTLLKADFKDLKEKQLKDLLADKIWLAQKDLLDKAEAVAQALGDGQFDDYDEFEGVFEEALKKLATKKRRALKLETKEKKQLLSSVSGTNPEAEPVIKKVLTGVVSKNKGGSPNAHAGSMYGAFEYKGQVVTFQTDGSLRDSEDVPLTAETVSSLWNAVLSPDNILSIIGRFIHLEIKEIEDWKGLKSKKEALIFPRYHQLLARTNIRSIVCARGKTRV